MQSDLRICFIDGESNTFADGLSRYPISTSLNIPKAEVQLFEKRSLLPMSIPLVGTPGYEEIDSQNKRMFSTTKYYASEDKLLRVPELIVTILDKYDDYQINPLTRFPQPLHDNLMNTYKLCKLNQQIKELDFDNHQIIKHRGRIWLPQDNYEHILWLIWSNHIHLDQHYGINETERRAKVNHDFQNMHRIIQLVVNACKTCKTCQTNKANNYTIVNYTFIPTPSEPQSIMSADHITDFPVTKDGYNEILIIVDLFTRYTYLIAAKKSDTAETTFQRLQNRFCLEGGFPTTILTDNGTKFRGDFHRHMTQRGITHFTTSIYRAKSNGANERMNGMVKQCLRSHCAFIELFWPQYLATTEFFINSRTHSTTKHSPHQLKFGYEPRWVDDNQKTAILGTNQPH